MRLSRSMKDWLAWLHAMPDSLTTSLNPALLNRFGARGHGTDVALRFSCGTSTFRPPNKADIMPRHLRAFVRAVTPTPRAVTLPIGCSCFQGLQRERFGALWGAIGHGPPATWPKHALMTWVQAFIRSYLLAFRPFRAPGQQRYVVHRTSWLSLSSTKGPASMHANRSTQAAGNPS